MRQKEQKYLRQNSFPSFKINFLIMQYVYLSYSIDSGFLSIVWMQLFFLPVFCFDFESSLTQLSWYIFFLFSTWKCWSYIELENPYESIFYSGDIACNDPYSSYLWNFDPTSSPLVLTIYKKDPDTWKDLDKLMSVLFWD